MVLIPTLGLRNLNNGDMISGMKIQVVIPAINLWNKYTKACIDSVKTSHEYRILLIDNASTDETLAEAGKLVSNSFSHKRNEERWSCAKSWNYGIKDAWERGMDYVVVLNNDVLLHPDAIDQMINRFEKSIISGDITKEINDRQHPVGMVTAMDVRGECPIPADIFIKKSEDYQLVAEAEHPNFSAFMLSKQCWDVVGEFDEGFKPAYFEDNDYHRRMTLAGMKALVYPPAMFYHFGSRTQNEALAGAVIVPGPVFEENKKYYHGKWGGGPGEDRFDHPFGNELNNIKWTKQQNG